MDRVPLYPLQREAFRSNILWLEDHDTDVDRFLDFYYMPEEHEDLWQWFLENPYYGRKIIEDFLKENDDKIQEVIHNFAKGKSKIIFVLGKRNAGKTATIFWLAEQVKDYRPVCCVMINGERKPQYPDWIRQIDNIQDATYGSFVFYDEGVLQVNARESGLKENIWLTKELAIARHKHLTVVFNFQHTKLGDVNIFRMADCSFIKPNNAFFKTDERTFTHSDLIKFMQPHRKELTLFVMDNTYIKFVQPLPECWTEEISEAHSHLDVRQYDETTTKTFENRHKRPKKQPAADKKVPAHHQNDKSLAALT